MSEARKRTIANPLEVDFTLLAEATALQAVAELERLRGLVYDPEGNTGGALHRYVRFSILALEARQAYKIAT